MEKKFVVLLLLVYLCSFHIGLCLSKNWSKYEKPDVVYRIVGGIETKPGPRYPFMVRLEESVDGGISTCGGSVLNENWIITAAHCVESPDPERYLAMTGLHDRTSQNHDVKYLKISKIVMHNDYKNNSFKNDIALLKTARPMNLRGSRGYIQSIRLPTTNNDPTGEATVIGWGWLGPGGPVDTLREVDVLMVKRNDCRKSYGKRITEGMICAGMQGKGFCKGDDGGPLFQYGQDGRPTLIGIVSFGKYCGRDGRYPGIYTKVSNFKNWIEQTVSK